MVYHNQFCSISADSHASEFQDAAVRYFFIPSVKQNIQVLFNFHANITVKNLSYCTIHLAGLQSGAWSPTFAISTIQQNLTASPYI